MYSFVRFALILIFISGCATKKVEKPVAAHVETVQPKKMAAKKKLKPKNIKIYQVKNGDTALGVAIKNSLTLSKLIQLNELDPPYKLHQGQKLKVLELKKTTIRKPSVKLAKFNLIWPVEGEIIAKFGKQQDGSYNDAIRIKADGEVQAAASGVVVYTGNEVGNYGNLVIIQHGGDWFSSYGNLSEILVQKGDLVRLKQKIAKIDNAELYFGLRSGSNPIDPLAYIKMREE